MPLVALVGLSGGGCASAPGEDSPPPPGVVPLSWYAGDTDETWDDARAGFDWALSQLGATPPPDGSAIVDVEAGTGLVRFGLDLDALDAPAATRRVLDDVAAELAAHPGSGDDDVGRFLMRSLHEPWRYYAATGACPTLADWSAAHLAGDTVDYAVTTSLLVAGHRRITLPTEVPDAGAVAMVALEGEGSLADGDFVPLEAETVDVMESGQFRYAVYDAGGALLPAAVHSAAGTPGRCAWCHEATLQPGTIENESAPGYLAYADWIVARDAAQAQVDIYRSSLTTAVDYAHPAVHEAGERLVEGFLAPDAARVAAEWGVEVAEVVAVLGEGTLTRPELGWSGRYPRAEVDALAPRPGAVATLPSARELADEAGLASAEPGDCR